MRHAPHRPLPAHAYIPGCGDRPADNAAPAPVARSEREWMLADDYLWGVDLFAHGFAWEAHDAWEQLWRVTPAGRQRELLQALIQTAAAMVKAAQSNAQGVGALARRALAHLESIDATSPFMGLDIDRLAAELRTLATTSGPQLAPRLPLIIRSRDRAGTLTDGAVEPAGPEWPGDGYLVRANPARPDFHSGQVVIVDDAPSPDQIEGWFVTFGRELAAVNPPFMKLCWETGDDSVWSGATALPDGTDYDHLAVLRCDRPPAPVARRGFTIRAFDRDSDWEAMTELSAESDQPPDHAAYRSFFRWRAGVYRDSVAAPGRGAFWGAFDGARLAGSLGLVTTPSWMRFRDVLTAPTYRRRGVCSALVTHALAAGFAAYPGSLALIVARAGADADRLYRRLGFAPIGSQHQLTRAATTPRPSGTP